MIDGILEMTGFAISFLRSDFKYSQNLWHQDLKMKSIQMRQIQVLSGFYPCERVKKPCSCHKSVTLSFIRVF